jgi:hypothetical protein
MVELAYGSFWGASVCERVFRASSVERMRYTSEKKCSSQNLSDPNYSQKIY